MPTPEAHGLYAPGLGLLGSPRLASASLALPAPATTAAAEGSPEGRAEAEGRLSKGRCPGRLQAPRALTRKEAEGRLIGLIDRWPD